MTTKERPVLFSGVMVKAILDESKTQTRRVIVPQPTAQLYCVNGGPQWTYPDPHDADVPDWDRVRLCPYGTKGDRLWVRENYHSLPVEAFERAFDSGKFATISADFKTAVFYAADAETGFPVRPSIHMPRWASRILLEVTDVRVERLQAITEADSQAEGVDREFRTVVMDPRGYKDYHIPLSYRGGFVNAWEQINGKKHPWSSDPYVWVVAFRQIGTEE